jgi:hypothetical protein
VILFTLDLEFADLRKFPPGTHPGILLFRPHSMGPLATQQTVSSSILLKKRILLPFRDASLWLILHVSGSDVHPWIQILQNGRRYQNDKRYEICGQG